MRIKKLIEMPYSALKFVLKQKIILQYIKQCKAISALYDLNS